MEATYHTFNPWWEGKPFNTGVPRDFYVSRMPELLRRNQIEILTGPRRSGKTTILKQLVKNLLDEHHIAPNEILYLALDHPALSRTRISEHLRNLRRIFGMSREKKIHLFLDEIQESPEWETEIKSIYDLEPVKMFCTGSTSSLVKSQGGKLTGRQIGTTVFPLSFSEMVRFRGGPPPPSEDYRFEKLADEYLSLGGYPEQVLNPSLEYLGNLVEDILARDLVRLSPVKKPFLLKGLLRLVSASVGSRTSFNRLSKVLGLSVDTVREYLGHLESAFLLAPLTKWTTSHSERVYAQKKFYLGDTGIKTVFSGAGDEGARAENAVFLELKRQKFECGYYAESEKEIDFVLGSPERPLPVEVKYGDLFDWRDKRYAGVRLFLRRFPRTKKVLIVSKNQETRTEQNGAEITVVPLWKFLTNAASYCGKIPG